MNRAKFPSMEVAAVFENHPEPIRTKLMELRQLILDTAAKTEGVGELEEALRWGEPSYLTSQSKSGTMIRIDSKAPDSYAMFFHCGTDLIERFRDLYPEFDYGGNRSITFGAKQRVSKKKLSEIIAAALTYKLTKRG